MFGLPSGLIGKENVIRLAGAKGGVERHLHVKRMAQPGQHRPDPVGLGLGHVVGLGLVAAPQRHEVGQARREIGGPLRLLVETVGQVTIGREIMIAMGL